MMVDKINCKLVMKRNHKYIVDNLKNIAQVIDKLFSKKVLSQQELEYLYTIKEPKKLARHLSLCLSKVTQASFNIFLQTLRDTGQEAMALRLDPGQAFSAFDEVDGLYQDFKIVNFDHNEVRMKTLNQADLDERFGNPRNYPMSRSQRLNNNLGRVLIINNYQFSYQFDNRHGSDKDVLLLETVFKKLHFNVQTVTDVTAKQLSSLLKQECRNFNKFNGFPVEDSDDDADDDGDAGDTGDNGDDGEVGYGGEDGEAEDGCLEGRDYGDGDRTGWMKGPQEVTKGGMEWGNERMKDEGIATNRQTDKQTHKKVPKQTYGPKYNSDAKGYRDMCVFILVLMSHGGRGHVYGVDGRMGSNFVGVSEVIDTFSGLRCPALLNKPKLIFVQACQNDEKETSEEELVYLRNIKKRDDNDVIPNVKSDTHELADVALMMSTVPGEKSLRDEEKGTFFIHILCHVICKHCHHWSLKDIILEVNAQHRSIIIRRTNGKIQQQPITQSTTHRNFYFLP